MKRLLMLLILLLLSFGQSLDAQRRKKTQDSLPDTVYLLNHYQKSPQWKHSTLRAKPPANAPRKKRNYGWDFLAPAWRGVQDSIDVPAFRYQYGTYEDYGTWEFRFDHVPLYISFYVRDEPTTLTADSLKTLHFTSMNDLEDLVSISRRRMRKLPSTIFIVHVTRGGVRMYRTFETQCNQGDICYVEVPRFINPDAIRASNAVILKYGHDFCLDDPEYPTTPELRNHALETSRRIMRYKHDVEWIPYFTRYHRGKYY